MWTCAVQLVVWIWRRLSICYGSVVQIIVQHVVQHTHSKSKQAEFRPIERFTASILFGFISND